MKCYPLAGTVGNKRKWFIKTTYRKPKSGEYFLSGAIPEVYQATNDLSTSFWIMIEVTVPMKIIQNGLEYRLVGTVEEE